jgi:hypothetical protein
MKELFFRSFPIKKNNLLCPEINSPMCFDIYALHLKMMTYNTQNYSVLSFCQGKPKHDLDTEYRILGHVFACNLY